MFAAPFDSLTGHLATGRFHHEYTYIRDIFPLCTLDFLIVVHSYMVYIVHTALVLNATPKSCCAIVDPVMH